MSLQELLSEASRPEYFSDRTKWYSEIARRALVECNDPRTPVVLCESLLEGGLSPWILGYDFHPRDGLDALMWLVAGNLGEPNAVSEQVQQLYLDREPRCQEVWDFEHVAYRCLTCGLSNNSCICVYCFDAEQHAGHDYRLYRSSAGGCCDCGDPLAWKPSGFCKRHALPETPLPSLLPPVVETGARIAIRAVVLHLIWALRRTFHAGIQRPEVSGTYGIARCIRWLSQVQGICSDMCKLVGEVLNEKRDACAESTGWGNYCPAFAAELVLDETATKALVRLGCFLPPMHSSELSALFLKLLLDSQFKAQFTSVFISSNDVLLCLLGASNPELRNWVRQEIGPVNGENDEMDITQEYDAHNEQAQDERITRKYSEEYPFFEPSDPPPHYVAPKSPRVFPNEVLSFNAKRFMDRIYCQIIHAESVALPGAEVLLNSMLKRLSDHFRACLYAQPHPGAGLLLDLSKLKRNFPLRIFAQLDLLFQHDSVCIVAMNDETRFGYFLSILRYCQLLNCLRRRNPDEEHVLMPDPYQQAYNLFFEIEALVAPILRACKKLLEDDANEGLIHRVLIQTQACLESWTKQACEGVLGQPSWAALLSPLTRFFFGLAEIVRKIRPQYLSNLGWTLDSFLPLCLPSLKAFNLLLEVQDSLWVRNGQTMLNSILFYVRLYSDGTIESDLLALRFPLLFFGNTESASTLEIIFEMWKDVLGDKNFLRVMGFLAFQGSDFTSTRNAAMHWLAIRDCTFSELDQMCPPPPGRQHELEKILEDIADFQDASTHPGGPPAHYKLKTVEWDNVVLGGFYLRFLRGDEEEALTRYKRVKNLDTNKLFIPVPRFPVNDQICQMILGSTSLYGVCLKTLSTSKVDEQLVTAALLCAGALDFFSKVQVDRAELFPRQSLKDLLDFNDAVKFALPANVFDTLKSLLAPVASAPSVAMDVEAGGQVAEEKIRTKAARAQQKALKAFAKKQKNFQFASDQIDSEPTPSPSDQSPTPNAVASEDVEVCALCRKSSDESEEFLGMMACVSRTTLLRVRESVTLEGEGKCVAHAVDATRGRVPVPTGITSSNPTYLSDRNVQSCIECVRHLLDNTSLLDDVPDYRSFLPNVDTRNVIHTCGHCVHPSCLQRYKEVVVNRARNNLAYEGMHVINVGQGELFCPVCRRVTNILVPLPNKVEDSRTVSSNVVMEGNADGDQGYVSTAGYGMDETPSSDDWLASRLDAALNEDSTLFPRADTSPDPSVGAVLDFFRNCPAIIQTSFPRLKESRYSPAELILTLLHFCDGTDKPPLTITKVLPSLMNLALRRPFDGGENSRVIQVIMSRQWSAFVRDTFCDSDRLRRVSRRGLTAVSQDLSLVLLNWILLNGNLRLELVTSAKVKEEAKRALRFLLVFARIQDALIRALFSDLPNGESSPSRRMPIESEIVRSAAVQLHYSEIEAREAFHRLGPKDREQLARLCASLTRETLTSSKEALVEHMRFVLQDFIPQDCPPYGPICGVDQLESKEDQLRRHAKLLFGEDVLDVEELTEAEVETTSRYVEQTLSQFFRELKELIGHTDRPMNTSVVVYRQRFSALLPRLYKASCPILVQLPEQYASFTVAYIARKAICPKCQSPPNLPAVCLLCGQLLCHDSDCCSSHAGNQRTDELVVHGAQCHRGWGRSWGVFLLVKSGQVLVLMDTGRVCVWGSLYLDAHDEEDRDLRRGKPLFLNKERLNTLEDRVRMQDWLLQSKILDKIRFIR